MTWKRLRPTIIGCAVGGVALLVIRDSTRSRPTPTPPAPVTTAPAPAPTPLAPALTEEELAAGPAQYTVAEVKNNSVGSRSRRTAEVTTTETERGRVLEAMMRAGVEVARNSGAHAVSVRLWVQWPLPPEPSDAEYEAMSIDERVTYLEWHTIRERIVYSWDGRGWGGDGGGTWEGLERSEIPAWIRRVCPGLRLGCRWWERM